jgi:predicted TIM-barrel fold metal-dependent hydrolase
VAVKGFLVVDGDAHYLEPIQEMTEYMAEPWRTRLRGADPSRWIPVGLGDRMLEGRIRREDAAYTFGRYDAGDGHGVEKAEELKVTMTKIGIDAAVLVPNRIVQMGHVSVRDLVVALNAGFIRYMLDKVCDPARGVYTMVIACWQDPRASAELIHEVADHPAVAAVCMMSAGANPPLGDVCYDPIYQAAADHGLPMVFHSAPGLNFVEGSDYASFQRLIESHSLGFSVSNMIQLTSVLLQGVPERFPTLKFVFEESGLFWVPMMQYRLDEYFLKRRSEAPLLQKLPSEYIRERFFFGTQPIEAPKNQQHLEMVFDAANGTSQFLFCSDYPHFDYDDPSAILRLTFLSREEKARVLSGNALGLFSLRKGGVQPWESISSPESTKSPTIAV